AQFGDITAGMQPGWRWCQKCQGMAYAGNPDPRACPAGGKHDTSHSAAHSMRFDTTPTAPVRQLKPHPFLVPHYLLFPFRGDLVRDEAIASLPQLLPHTETSYKLITIKKTATDLAQSSTVLDSQTEQSAQSFNQNLKDSADAKFGNEHYDYGMQGNFHGE